MTLKHIEDGGDLSLLISDSGELLIVCGAQRPPHMWVMSAERWIEQAARTTLVRPMRSLARSLSQNAGLAQSVGVDIDAIAD